MSAVHGGRAILLWIVNLIGLAAFLWPFVVPELVGSSEGHAVDAPIIFVLVLACVGALLFVELGRGGMGPKAVALIGVLGGLMIALRLPGFVAGFSAMFIVVLVAGNSFGPGFGFVLGAVGTLASGLFIGGLGPWLPFQMVAVGWVGLGAGLVPRSPSWPRRIGALGVYGILAGYAFGAIMNLWFWPFAASSGPAGWSSDAPLAVNARHYLTFYVATSLAWDTFAAVGNAVLVAALGRPLLGSLDRAARRMRLEVRHDRPPAAPARQSTWSRPGGRSSGEPRVEESPGSTGQDAGESPRRGDSWTVPQKTDRPGPRAGVRVKR